MCLDNRTEFENICVIKKLQTGEAVKKASVNPVDS
jgi:hypothetical protein